MTDYDLLYSEKPNRWSKIPERDMFVYAAIEKPESVLDFGCGVGHTILYLSERWKGTRFYGLDISKKAIEIAKNSVDGAEFVCGEWFDKKVDLVILMGVAEHFEKLEDLRKIRDLLNPGGKVYLEVPDCMSTTGRGEEGYFLNGVQEEWHLKRETWEEVILKSGFEILRSLEGNSPDWKFIWILGVSNA